MIQNIERLAKGYAFRAKRRETDGSNQQDGRDHGHDALDNHMNSFSFVRSVYKAATCAP